MVFDRKTIMDFFGYETDPIVGLDIGSSSIKLLQMSKQKGRLQVDNFAVVRLPDGAILEKNVVDPQKVADAIKEVVTKSGIKSQRVCTAISNSVAITKIVKMANNLNDKEIGSEIELEAGKIIPYPINEINLDYVVLGPVPNIDTMVNVLVVATKTDNIDKLSSIIIDAGLIPTIIDIDAYAIARAFSIVAGKLPDHGHDKVIAIFDIGGTMSTLNILDNMNVVHMREQSFGSAQLVDEVQNIYGLTYEEAILAMQYENLPKDYHREVLDPFKQMLTQQISRACQFFISGGEYSNIDYIFLTGGCTDIFGIDKAVQDKLQIKTFVANPFDNVTLAEHINKNEFKEVSDRFMKCCGLAMRNIEL